MTRENAAFLLFLLASIVPISTISSVYHRRLTSIVHEKKLRCAADTRLAVSGNKNAPEAGTLFQAVTLSYERLHRDYDVEYRCGV